MIEGNFEAFIKALKKEEARLLRQVNDWYILTVFDIVKDIIVSSPQYSGNLAMNWCVGIDSPDSTEIRSPLKGDESDWYLSDPYSRGDDPAVTVATNSAMAALANLTFRKTAILTNNAPYAEDVENDIPPPGRSWRASNLIDGRPAMIAYAYEKYK